MRYSVKHLHSHGKKYADFIGGWPSWVQNLEKGNVATQLMAGIALSCVAAGAFSAFTNLFNNLPKTMTPENEAKHLAWMKYNNVNPIFGISAPHNK